ncbi:MAG: YggS family pyridoxal phosphate-dependent enzyme [Clostridia bacterium]|nr:YggS family pyridoxal phosphate-dependent enzyme [Clostridia bacterium]
MDEAFVRIGDNIARIREEIRNAELRAGAEENSVRLMAVTKTVAPELINRAIDCGIDLIGENKVQEFLLKRDSLNLEGVEKRLIGHLQTNKVKKIVGEVDLIESVDSVNLAREIGKRAGLLGITQDVLIEVNVGGEESKTGLDKSKLTETVDEIAEIGGIRVRGLMTIAPICEKSAQVRNFFTEMYKLFIDIQSEKKDNIDMQILSMGMSGDYIDAVLCGSNSVRVGSAIFGARHY